MQDTDFLALLVHRGHVERADAQALLGRLRDGEALDDLLFDELGWDDEKIERMRRTRAGEWPEIPGYRIRETLGTGGTATVYLARDLKRNRQVALKVLSREAASHEPTRKAFIAEGRLLEKLSHPGLVRGFGVARAGPTFFSRLEAIQGSTLLELLDGGRVFAEGEALEIVLRVAEVLRYLEEKGVVHRDVKPGNVMLAKDGRVVLIDLGFAATRGEETGAESAVGTVAYLSPEQARGGAEADIRSDIYSLGLSLFHLVVGKLPFESSDDREVLRMQVMDSLRSPELKGRGISPHLHYFIEKMVAKDAADRYQHWSELIADVRGQLEGRDELDFSTPPPRGGVRPRRRR
ncbi:MAG TPA: serine/threonine protein kinase [Planctomycetes bacterium]|nr:serine/threonine protein kinase [Planctomycetota bacterium]